VETHLRLTRSKILAAWAKCRISTTHSACSIGAAFDIIDSHCAGSLRFSSSSLPMTQHTQRTLHSTQATITRALLLGRGTHNDDDFIDCSAAAALTRRQHNKHEPWECTAARSLLVALSHISQSEFRYITTRSISTDAAIFRAMNYPLLRRPAIACNDILALPRRLWGDNWWTLHSTRIDWRTTIQKLPHTDLLSLASTTNF
jgi:hypothetical protein